METLLNSIGGIGNLTDLTQEGMQKLNANLEEMNKLKVLEIVMNMPPEEDPEMRAEAVKELRRYFF